MNTPNSWPHATRQENHEKRTVFYDGGCLLCRRVITHYQKLDREHHIEWQDISQTRETLDRHGFDWGKPCNGRWY
ncbi:MAG TPA: DUF393 domain-containing protein [Halothiobacillaceae bacterium]|nr:DUF393 domain-containing protein [Halothiobacillaceae bacterium]